MSVKLTFLNATDVVVFLVQRNHLLLRGYQSSLLFWGEVYQRRCCDDELMLYSVPVYHVLLLVIFYVSDDWLQKGGYTHFCIQSQIME